jgi:hypothetical protein
MAFFVLAGGLFFKVIVPILIVIGIGAVAQRTRPLDIPTLSRLQVYILMPAFLFIRLFESDLTGRQIATVALTTALIQALLVVPLYLFGRWKKLPQSTLLAIVMGAAVFNAGNFGIPVAERAFGRAGGAVQGCIILAANLSLWAISYVGALKEFLKLPILWAILLALGLKSQGVHPPEPLLYPLRGMADTIVILSQLTLGAQLVSQWRRPRWRLVLPIAALKLLALPALAAGIVWALKLWPWPGAAIIVAAASPTAVNTMLLTIEKEGDVELSAECVFWTTLLSALTVTGVLTAVIALGGGPPQP